MENYQAWAEETLKKVREKMAWVSEKNKDIIPYTTDENGNYDDRSAEDKQWNHDDGLNWWTNGFWGGIMWLLYQDTKEEKYADIARISEKKMEKCFESYFGLHHDVGFMFLPTAVADYRLTGNEDSRRIAMHAASLLAGRFNPVGRFIRAWNQVPGSDTRGWAIIDCMFNICLLYWASEESGDPRFRQMAMMHADTVMENFIRPDGSVCHIVEFDPETGEMVKSHGGQGYGEGSSWTRGQGWALYGFANSYTHTGKQEYLDTAKKVLLHCQYSGERNHSGRLQTAGRAGLGGFLRSLHHCRRTLRGSKACAGAGKENVHPCSSQDPEGNRRDQSGLDEKL